VEEKTKDIQLKNEALQTSEEELRQNMEELETNQELLKEQKQTIEEAFGKLNKQNTKVNDSIRYAQRIQNAILPHENILDAAFSEHFVVFKPKDVVSGDFYWYLEVENKKFLAVVDCTGHGVPGAFMSMIGNTLLYEIINAKGISEPDHILEQLHLGILNSLNSKDANIQDGMDIALCCIEKQIDNKVKVQFSGAKRPLYYFSKQELIEVQADRKSIGQSLSSQLSYTRNEITLQAGDTLYMSTDGWIDSINPERKRFGSRQFKEILLQGANLPLRVQGEVFRHILESYEQGTEQRDDVLLVGVKV
jgi:serine phosphatase RsbU (regulator of sigma subunit)